MPEHKPLQGVFAAALTPLRQDGKPDLQGMPEILDLLARRGCHGALVLGTTGEGPSFSASERQALFEAALSVRQAQPEFRLLAGSGSPSLEETVALTRSAFDLGFDGVVVLPPYYFRKAIEEGLFAWFAEVFHRAVPAGGKLFYYHIPAVTGIYVTHDFFARLLEAFPGRFVGLKDSTAEAGEARRLGQRFGKDLLVLNGTDRLFSLALEAGAGGCITALANLASPELRQVWEAHQRSETCPEVQGRLDAAREVLERYPPAAPLLKALYTRWFSLPLSPVRLPLLPMPIELADQASAEMKAALGSG
jgi:4-hydroxy-tetrahydrodipicolinate synthase